MDELLQPTTNSLVTPVRRAMLLLADDEHKDLQLCVQEDLNRAIGPPDPTRPAAIEPLFANRIPESLEYPLATFYEVQYDPNHLYSLIFCE